MFDLSGKRALVTGSTQGIGLAIARCLAEHGATVFIHGATNIDKCEQAAASINGKTKTVLQDLAAHDCAEKLYAQTGDLDILVLNASVQVSKAWDQITEFEFDRQTDVNFRASLSLMQKYAPSMLRQKWGRIVAVGSVQQYKPHKDMAVYAATKCAQMSLIQNLSKQFIPSGVTVNTLSPGVIDTPRSKDALADNQYRSVVLGRIPAGFVGEPKDCAGAALLLCSEEGRYITGIDLPVDGGMRL